MNWEGCGRKGICYKNGIVCASASVIFPCTTKSTRWWALTEEVDSECSKFYVTVGTVTRIASILIHSRSKALAVNMSWPSSQLWLYAGLIGCNNPRWLKVVLVVCANPSSSSSWVWAGECCFWYWLTQVVPDKGPLSRCVCVCMSVCVLCRSVAGKQLQTARPL